MKRRRTRTKPPKGTLHEPIVALHLIRGKVTHHLNYIRGVRVETNDPALSLKEREWENIQAVIDLIMRDTEPLKELEGWKIGDCFTEPNRHTVYAITEFPSLTRVHGVNINKYSEIGGVTSITTFINNIKRAK